MKRWKQVLSAVYIIMIGVLGVLAGVLLLLAMPFVMLYFIGEELKEEFGWRCGSDE